MLASIVHLRDTTANHTIVYFVGYIWGIKLVIAVFVFNIWGADVQPNNRGGFLSAVRSDYNEYCSIPIRFVMKIMYLKQNTCFKRWLFLYNSREIKLKDGIGTLKIKSTFFQNKIIKFILYKIHKSVVYTKTNP